MADEQELSTEDTILDSIGESNAPDTEAEDQVTEPSQGEAEATDTTATEAGQEAVSSDATKQEAQQTAGPQDLKLADGTIIKGGPERRLYEKGVKVQRDLSNVQQQLKEATTKLEAYESTNSLGTQYNLSPDELTTGAQLIAAYKSDPIATVKHMLTQAQSQGHNIEDIGGTTDMGAIKAMIQEAVSPLTQRQQQETEAQTQREEAVKVWTDFQAEHPDSAVHETSLAQLLREEPSLSLPAAYFKLRSMYLERNLDWTKPLGQLQEEAQQQPQVNTAQTETIPSGTNVANGSARDSSEVADVDTPLDDIIKQSMRDAGIN